jgi:beta-glucosidase
MQDSPLSVRFADYVSGFPAGINAAATWDRDMSFARGKAMAEEHRGKGVDAQLGPVCGPLGKFPNGGRNWEGFSPDPYLTGALIAPTIQGLQSAGVMATTKHFIGNEQEHFRQVGESQDYGYHINATLSSNIDDKTMHELYMWPFADAVRAGTAAIMCSYTQINNSYGCQNSYTMNYLLKNELDFQGFIMSDWQANHAGVPAVMAGMDMSMPGDTLFNSGYTFYGTNLTIAVLNGTVPQWRVDDMATRIMAAYYYVGRDQHQVPVNFDSWTPQTYGPIHYPVDSPIGLVNEHIDVRGDHAKLIREIARASTVLLKNDGVLPLTGNERNVGIFGRDAGSSPNGVNGCADHGCDEGTLASGWGSGTNPFPYLVTPEEAIQNYVITNTDGITSTITDNSAHNAINDLADQVDVALVFANADSGEGFIVVDGNEGDRNNLTLWYDGEGLIREVAARNNNTIVVIHSVGAVDMAQWHSHPNVTAILWAGLPGQESGNAIVDVLYGHYNPGGKLPFTMGASIDDYGTKLLTKPNNGHGAPQDDYSEGLFIDYRHFDANGITPLYEFGFGMSYTSFSYANLRIKKLAANPYKPTRGMTGRAPVLGNENYSELDKYLFPSESFPHVPLYLYPYINTTDLAKASGDPDYGKDLKHLLPPHAADSDAQPLLPAGGAPGGNPSLWEAIYTVTATIKNTGKVMGDEVVQLYVSLGSGEPERVLRGFDRLSIQPQESVDFEAKLTRRDLSTWDTVSQNWVESKNVTVWVGSSSRNLPLSSKLQ